MGTFMKLKTFNELPNQKDIRDIVKLIRDYTFPNFFRESPNRDIVKKSIAKLYMKIVTDDSSLLDFIEQLDDIVISLEHDLEFFYQSDPASKSYDEIIFTYPGCSSGEVYNLIREAEVTVKEKLGIDLERSITLLGNFTD